MATQMTMQAMGPTRQNSAKMISHGLPSPTLTNPDMVLPDEPMRYAGFASPSRNPWRERPPSPSYLRDTPPQSVRDRSSSGGSNIATPKKEKRGLMSRKMLLLRSRTSSSGLGINAVNGTPNSRQSDHEFSDFDAVYGSSPTLMDVGNLAPETPDHRRESAGGSSMSSDDMKGLPQFLVKYESQNSSGTEDEWEKESPAAQKHADLESEDESLDAHRRQQEEDEQQSAILSKRAEQILANAKKRLNLMEGNLRGARDLVQPLTAANLKRATSVGSYASPGNTYGMRGRYVHDGYQYQPSHQQQHQRQLQPQASSPTMGQDFQGHYRGFSEVGIPNRPHTSLERTNTPIGATARLPQKSNEQVFVHGLKESRSYDSLGHHALRRPTSRDPSYTRGSPNPNLHSLVEDDDQEHAFAPPHSRFSDRQDSYAGSSRSSSRTDNLREQMSSLQGKISTLKQRAREDSKRRASIQNLREPSPLNNAAVTAPEFFYTTSPTYGSPMLDTNAGKGWSSPNYSPVQKQPPQQSWEPQPVLTGSRNAFAEQERRRGSEDSQAGLQKRREPDNQTTPTLHRRTPSGRVIVESSRHRYSHHQYNHMGNASEELAPDEKPNTDVGVARSGPDDDDAVSQSEVSIYEDAETDQPAPVVAHEDREDAFDYQQFWVNSVMSNGYARERSASVSSEESGSSVETARGPTRADAGADAGADADAGVEDGDEEVYDDDQTRPPPSPETPERLREIERNLHKRTFSDESVSTIASFATAAEGRESPVAAPKRSNTSRDYPTSRSEPNSRPATAIPIKRPSPIALARSDSSSERADSGVGLPHRSHSSQSTKRSPLSSTTGKKTFSPPMSPGAFTDPATVAVNAVLESNGRQLGLKDKALLFSLVESLRSVCHQMQERSENDFESRALRRRLDDARKILNGAMS